MRTEGESLKNWLWRFEPLSALRSEPWLFGAAAALVLLGLMMTLNTTYFLSLSKTGAPFSLFKRQLVSVALGLTAMVLVARIPAHSLQRIARGTLVVSVILLLAVWIPGLGVTKSGARRWLGLGRLTIEPSELAKLAWVVFLADFLSRNEERIRDFRHGLLPPLLLFLVLAAIVLSQPDFGAAVILALLLFAMAFAAGVPIKQLGAVGGVLSALFAYQAWHKSYRARRMLAFAHPWQLTRSAGFQLVQSLIALGAGGKWGVGLGAGEQKMFYLPQAHTDFVFAVVGEELGLVGALTVVSLFAMILVRGMRIARNEPEPFASLLATGMTALLAFQALINMAVVTGLLPTKGLALPFLSYGGSAMMISLAALGVLLGLGRHARMQ
jgi:cell division protein FtsW